MQGDAGVRRGAGTGVDSPVRALTIGVPDPSDTASLFGLAEAVVRVAEGMRSRGHDIQTVRLSLPELDLSRPADDMRSRVDTLAAVCATTGLDSAAVGIIPPGVVDDLDPTLVAELLLTRPALYASAGVVDAGTVAEDACVFAGRVVRLLADADADATFRFAATGSVAPGCPMLPGAYSSATLGLSVGLQSAAELTAAARRHRPSHLKALTELTTRVVTDIIDRVDTDLSAELLRSPLLRGIAPTYDPSPACSPDAGIVDFLEVGGRLTFGDPGTMATCAAVTTGLRAVRRPQVGYSGLMLPVLEDPLLARAWSDGRVGLHDLLAYSAVCGTGLDAVPLVPATTAAEIAAIISDMAALSARWLKPLSVRVMPGTPGSDPRRTEMRGPHIINIDHPHRPPRP